MNNKQKKSTKIVVILFDIVKNRGIFYSVTLKYSVF